MEVVGQAITEQLDKLKAISPNNTSQLADKTYLCKLFLETLEEFTEPVKKYYEQMRKDLCAAMLREDTGKLDKGTFTASIQTKSYWSPILEYKGDVLDYFKNSAEYADLWTITSTDLNKTLTEIGESGKIPPELEGKIRDFIDQHVRITAKKAK